MAIRILLNKVVSSILIIGFVSIHMSVAFAAETGDAITESPSVAEEAAPSADETPVSDPEASAVSPDGNASSPDSPMVDSADPASEDASAPTENTAPIEDRESDMADTSTDPLGASGAGSAAEASTTTEATSTMVTEELQSDDTLTDVLMLDDPVASTSSLDSTTSLEELGDATGTPTIVSGDAIALANILNLVNTNFVNSDGVVVFNNFFETLFGDFDLRSIYDSIAQFGCSLISCPQHDVTTTITNDATIQNDLLIQALTGRNNIEGGSTSTIQTGDAYAGLNLINMANTNVIDSNYLLVTMNAFHDVNGDIVFPSLSNFFRTLSGGVSADALNITDTAEIVNDMNIDASTGNNTTDGAGAITTGTSEASTNVFNQLNTSLAGGQSISIVFRVHGNWAGEIFGAPPGLEWMEDGHGGIYLFDTGSGGSSHATNLTLNATNTASIHNNINVVALTGENAITGADTALISTGNAYAGANIMNIANATVVGRNWILAVINILGDFRGNISFGRPDLWVGAQVDVPRSIQNESDLTYTFTVINNGDSPASQVRLMDDYDERHVDIRSASVPYETTGDGKILWQLGTLEPGKATEITYTARIKDTTYSTDITNLLSVSERESDNNKSDNTETITVTTDHKPVRNGGNVRLSLSDPSSSSIDESVLTIDRITASTTLIEEPHEAAQKIVLTNTSDRTIRAVVVHDILSDPSGDTIKDEVWELGDVLPHEEVTIEYTIAFAPKALQGTYALTTSVKGGNLASLIERANGHILLFDPIPDAEPFLTLAPLPPSSEVLGATVTTEEIGEEEASGSFLPFLIPTALAATRIDHGLPMTHVPYRYSTYLFFLAIALSNLYYMARRSRGMNNDTDG